MMYGIINKFYNVYIVFLFLKYGILKILDFCFLKIVKIIKLVIN